MKSLQDTYAPHTACFGCGPANAKGLRIKSFAEGEECIAEYRVQKHHEAFPGVVNGGIIGTLLDCHSNWTATWALLRRSGAKVPPCTVTADFHLVLKRPTPSDALLECEHALPSCRTTGRSSTPPWKRTATSAPPARE